MRKVLATLAAAALGACSGPPASPASPVEPVAAVAPGGGPAASTVVVSFRLDPGLTSGLYLGERWVSPAVFTASQVGPALKVSARVQANRPGQQTAISAEWSSADPSVASVLPATGHEVQITAQGVGRTTIHLGGDGWTKTLTVVVSTGGDRTHVQVSQ